MCFMFVHTFCKVAMWKVTFGAIHVKYELFKGLVPAQPYGQAPVVVPVGQPLLVVVVELIVWSLQAISGWDLTWSPPLRVEEGKQLCLMIWRAALDAIKSARPAHGPTCDIVSLLLGLTLGVEVMGGVFISAVCAASGAQPVKLRVKTALKSLKHQVSCF